MGVGGEMSLDGDEEGESCKERKRKREWEVRVKVVFGMFGFAARYTSPYEPALQLELMIFLFVPFFEKSNL